MFEMFKIKSIVDMCVCGHCIFSHEDIAHYAHSGACKFKDCKYKCKKFERV